MVYNNNVFSSSNRGAAWTLLSTFPVSAGTVGSTIGNNTRTWGKFIAVDPANANVVYVSTPANGVYVTTNGGTSWSSVSSVTASSDASYGSALIAFDPSSSVSGGKTQGIYIESYGQGVWHSTNAGASWTQIVATGTPTTGIHMVVDGSGIVWLIDANFHVNEYSSGAWTVPVNNMWAVAVDPNNLSHIFCITSGGGLYYTLNSGSSWNNASNNTNRTATDVPWLAWTNENFMSAGDIKFDPAHSNILDFAEGIGFWDSDITTENTSTQTSFWTSQTAGIENLDGAFALSVPSGSLIFSFWDRPFFYGASATYVSPACTGGGPTAYPCEHGVNNTYSIIKGYSVDYCTGSSTALVGLANSTGGTVNDTSGYSTDGGKTWSTFAAIPSDVVSSNFIGGSIACGSASGGSPQNVVWCESNGGSCYCSVNGGSSWTVITTVPGATGGTNYYLSSFTVASDKVTGQFYIYTPNTGGGSDGVYTATSGCTSWTSKGSPGIQATFNTKFRSVPGESGNLFLTAGVQSPPHPAAISFYKSTNNGQTWTIPNSNVQEIYSFGFGAPQVNGNYPTLYIWGWISNVLGIWRSGDGGVTYTSINNGYPANIFSQVIAIEGDMNTYGTVYVNTGGSGVIRGTLNYLLERDLDPATNDNSPVYLDKVG